MHKRRRMKKAQRPKLIKRQKLKAKEMGKEVKMKKKERGKIAKVKKGRRKRKQQKNYTKTLHLEKLTHLYM